MLDCMRELFALHRSQTGEGVRETFRRLQKWLHWDVSEVPTGTSVLDWKIPAEWRIHDASISTSTGERLIAYVDNPLHVVSNSQAVDLTMSAAELEPHLKVDANAPTEDSIPYRTAFFRNDWGFCVSRKQYRRLMQDRTERFRVVVDAEHFPGSLTYGESILPGKSPETILIYAHCCHPNLANDNLSGMVVATFLGRWLQARVESGEILRKSYRIILAPATIGAIAWLSHHRDLWPQFSGGLVLSMLAGSTPFTYKQSRVGNSATDRAVNCLAQSSTIPLRIREFEPFGYDERQFCSPGINLPVGCLMRSTPSEFPNYHSSEDHLDRVTPDELNEALGMAARVLWMIEQNDRPLNTRPYGEPFLGGYDLYRGYGQNDDRGRLQEALMWVLNLADGSQDLLEITHRSRLPFDWIYQAAKLLEKHQLITWASSVLDPQLVSLK